MAKVSVMNFYYIFSMICEMQFATWRGITIATPLYENFQRLSQLIQVTNVVIGSSAERVCIW